MNTIIYPSQLSGTIVSAPSKSITQRALIMASFLSTKTIINNPLVSLDTTTTIEELKKIGIKFTFKNNKIIVERPNEFKISDYTIECNASATTLRMLLVLFSNLNEDFVFTGTKKLLQRIKDIDFLALGLRINNDYNFITVKKQTEESLIDITHTSQSISAFIISKCFHNGSFTLYFKNELDPYIIMTLKLLNQFGFSYELLYIDEKYQLNVKRIKKINKVKINVEGDYTLSSNFLVASTFDEIEIKNLMYDSIQYDKIITDTLIAAGIKVTFYPDFIIVHKSDSKPINVDISKCPDLAFAYVSLALRTNGKSTITNLQRLIDKESNRLKSIDEILSILNVEHSIIDDTLIINSTGFIEGGVTIDSFDDHRVIFMITSIASIINKEIKILNSDAINKSYPNFFDDFAKVGGKFKHEDIGIQE